jgi:predicted DCC family thiol-disulfide oxidoreductase YuxK
LLFPRKRSSQSSLIQRVLAASTRRTACILFDGVCVLCSRGCGFVSKHDRRAYFRIVPMQLAEARDLVQSIGSEHTSAAVSNIAQIPGGQKRKAKNSRNAIPKRSVFSSS